METGPHTINGKKMSQLLNSLIFLPQIFLPFVKPDGSWDTPGFGSEASAAPTRSFSL
jgi:hypothetical protein